MPQDIQDKEIKTAAIPNLSPKPIRKTTKPRKRRSISQGRPTILTDELMAEIRTHAELGESEESIQKTLKISGRTWRQWKLQDYAGFRDMLAKARYAAMVLNAERFSNELMNLPTDAKNARIAAIKQKEAEYLRSNLKSDTYAKKQEENAAALTINLVNFALGEGQKIKLVDSTSADNKDNT